MPSTHERLYSSGDLLNGKYRLLRLLGKGSFGPVYLAKDVYLARDVAIKIVSATEDSAAAERLQREFSVLSRINHPNIVRVYDFGILEDGNVFLVSEFIEGRSLHQILNAKEVLSQHNALVICKAIADGLSAAHSVNIIHRDLKPSNVMVPEDQSGSHFDHSRLIDFGVLGELLRKSEQGNVTQAGMIFGTFYYMSPEQIHGQPQSTATDLYGLGSLLYEMLFGQPPFKSEKMFETMHKILYEEVAIPETEVSATIRSLILSLLSKDPKNRPQSATAVAEQIQRILENNDLLSLDTEVALHLPSVEQPTWAKSHPERHVPAASAEQISKASPYESTMAVEASPGTSFPKILMISLLAIIFFVVIALGFIYKKPGVIIGCIMFTGGLALSTFYRFLLTRHKPQLQDDALRILTGAKSYAALSGSLALEVGQLIENCRRIEEKILGRTIAVMMTEYENAKESKDKQNALMNAVSLLEKLTERLSPWYVRHQKLIAVIISIIGMLSGLASAAASLLKK
jgi:serine/threonine protein kinase